MTIFAKGFRFPANLIGALNGSKSTNHNSNDLFAHGLYDANLGFIFWQANFLHHFPIIEWKIKSIVILQWSAKVSAIFMFTLYIWSALAISWFGKKCDGVDHQLPFSTCVGTLRIRVNTKYIFEMPSMMILLRYRVTVSISDGKTKIDDRYWQPMFTTLSATKVSKNTG